MNTSMAEELHTSRRVGCQVFIVQPLSLSQDLFLQVISSKKSVITQNTDGKCVHPDWWQERSVGCCIATWSVTNRLDASDDMLKAGIFIDNTFNYDLIVKSAVAYVIEDSYIPSWTLCYELDLSVSIEEVLNYKNNKPSLYKFIRDSFVQSLPSDAISSWAMHVRQELLTIARLRLSESVKDEIPLDALMYECNSGNVTFVVDATSGLHESVADSFFIKLSVIHQSEERLANICEEHEFGNEGKLIFGGRFHTIIVKDTRDLIRYHMLQLQLQYMWFQLGKLHQYMSFVMTNTVYKPLDDWSLTFKPTAVMDGLILRVKQLSMNDEAFRRMIELDGQCLYPLLATKWNIVNMKSSLNDYADCLRQEVSRIEAKQRIKSDSLQNKFLLVISILQAASLIGVWDNYISILNEKGLEETSFLVELFGGVQHLVIFNVFLPLILTVLLILIWLVIKRTD